MGDAAWRLTETAKCLEAPWYFVDSYCDIYDAVLKSWIPFHLWPEQVEIIHAFYENQLVVVLKARQLGLTWLALCFALWLMIFQPISTILVFSRRDDEAMYLLGRERLRGVYKRLPDWFKKGRTFLSDSGHEWALSNGSSARALPTTAGDSYTVSFLLIDEADLVPDLNTLLKATKPTIDAGGKMALISRSNKAKPQSEFKSIYRGGKAGKTKWVSIFLPWHVRPSRDEVWYADQVADCQARTGGLDDVHEQYPATDAEALAPKTLDKRILATWLLQCFHERTPLPFDLPGELVSVPGLEVFLPPVSGWAYVIGADPAEGNPTSNASAFTVLNKANGEEVAKFHGAVQPSEFGSYLDQVGMWFNRATVMVERNNHGHAVLLWLNMFSKLEILTGHDGKEGWLSSARGKTLLYTFAADAFYNKETRLHSFDTYTQLCSIEGSTLKAPEGELDDLADSYALALAALALNPAPVPLSDHSALMLEKSVWH